MKAKTYFYAALTVFLLIACDKNGGANTLTVHSGANYPGGGAGSPSQNQQQGLPTAGSQTLQTDVTKTQEYQKSVLPIGQKIASFKEFSLPDEENVSSSSPSRMTDFFAELAQSKKWGLANLNNQATSTADVSANQNRQINGRNGMTVTNTNNVIPTMQRNSGVGFYQDVSVKITPNAIYLDQKTYNNATPEFRGQMILRALVFQLYINQYDTATNLLNRLATVDAKVKTQKTSQQAQSSDDNEKLDPVMPQYQGTVPSSDMTTLGSFRALLSGDLSKITQKSFNAAVKATFARGNGFARPYVMSSSVDDGSDTETDPTPFVSNSSSSAVGSDASASMPDALDAAAMLNSSSNAVSAQGADPQQ